MNEREAFEDAQEAVQAMLNVGRADVAKFGDFAAWQRLWRSCLRTMESDKSFDRECMAQVMAILLVAAVRNESERTVVE